MKLPVKNKLSIKGFCSKCDQIRSFLFHFLCSALLCRCSLNDLGMQAATKHSLREFLAFTQS